MKARLVLDQFADVSKVTDAMRDKLKFIPHETVKGKVVAIFPAGTEFKGDQAVFLCRTGQAAPSDDECAEAIGLSDAQSEAVQREYKMTTLGINSPEDRELFRAGVITGYDEARQYIPGPNWDAYQQAIADSEDLEDELDDVEASA